MIGSKRSRCSKKSQSGFEEEPAWFHKEFPLQKELVQLQKGAGAAPKGAEAAPRRS